MRKMVGFYNIILLFIEIVGNDDLVWIFLCIDGVLLQADVHFAETHRGWVCTKRFPESKMVAVFHGTDLLAFKVCKAVDRFVCTHNTEALVCHTKKMIAAFGIDVADQAVELWIVDLFTAVIQRIEYARKVKYSKVVHEGNLRCSILNDKRNVAVCTGLQKVTVTAEGGVCVNLNLHFAVA